MRNHEIHKHKVSVSVKSDNYVLEIYRTTLYLWSIIMDSTQTLLKMYICVTCFYHNFLKRKHFSILFTVDHFCVNYDFGKYCIKYYLSSFKNNSIGLEIQSSFPLLHRAHMTPDQKFRCLGCTG